MNRGTPSIPHTPVRSSNPHERSTKRRSSTGRMRESIADIARRVTESPLNAPSSQQRRRHPSRSGRDGLNQASQELPADFQEWMKMVRMKRVKANNAFSIQLIDAFHSMVRGHVLSQDGQPVTFQEATHTLGGCLTVYKSRVASVKDDTNRLLIGVTEKTVTAADEDIASDDDSSEEEGSGSHDGSKSPRRKRKQKSSEPGTGAYLAPEKKLEIDVNELATVIDPLLRKMSADFDKRGAGAMLQYSLKPDKSGRLLLDADIQESDEQAPSTSTGPTVGPAQGDRLPAIIEEEEEKEEDSATSEVTLKTEHTPDAEPQETVKDSENLGNENSSSRDPQDPITTSTRTTYDLAFINVSHFSNINLKRKEALPLVDMISHAVANPQEGTEALIKDMEAWAMADPRDSSTYDAINLSEDEEDGERADGALFNSAPLEGLGLDFDDGAFGGLNNQLNDMDDMDVDDDLNDNDVNASIASIASIASSRLPASGNWMDPKFMQQLDQQRANWAGPQHWKIQRLHQRESDAAQAQRSESASKKRTTIASVPSVIDFMSEQDVDLGVLFEAAPRSSLLSSRQYNSTNKHLIPQDMGVTTSQLFALQLRPDSGFAPVFSSQKRSLAEGAGDDSYFGSTSHDGQLDGVVNDFEGVGDLYGGWDDLEAENEKSRPFTTAAAMFSHNTQKSYGGRRNQLNYARTAKRVDVRRLKDNVWNAIKSTSDTRETPTNLLQVIHDTQPLYGEQQRSDLSPAMYFISLLHLSNEKGLTLENNESFTNIQIRPSTTA